MYGGGAWRGPPTADRDQGLLKCVSLICTTVLRMKEARPATPSDLVGSRQNDRLLAALQPVILAEMKDFGSVGRKILYLRLFLQLTN